MKRLIHKYLSEYYRIGFTEYNILYVISMDRKSVPKHKLIPELCKLFGLEKSKLKWYIKSWIKKQNKSFHFTKWWNPWHGHKYTLPMKPMKAPSGLLHYMDYVISVDPVIQNNDRQAIGVYTPYIDEQTREMTIRRWERSGLLDEYRANLNDIFQLYERQRNQIILGN